MDEAEIRSRILMHLGGREVEHALRKTDLINAAGLRNVWVPANEVLEDLERSGLVDWTPVGGLGSRGRTGRAYFDAMAGPDFEPGAVPETFTSAPEYVEDDVMEVLHAAAPYAWVRVDYVRRAVGLNQRLVTLAIRQLVVNGALQRGLHGQIEMLRLAVPDEPAPAPEPALPAGAVPLGGGAYSVPNPQFLPGGAYYREPVEPYDYEAHLAALGIEE